MKINGRISSMTSRLSLRKILIMGILLAWTLFFTIIAVPAPPPGGAVGPN